MTGAESAVGVRDRVIKEGARVGQRQPAAGLMVGAAQTTLRAAIQGLSGIMALLGARTPRKDLQGKVTPP